MYIMSYRDEENKCRTITFETAEDLSRYMREDFNSYGETVIGVWQVKQQSSLNKGVGILDLSLV